MSTIAYSSQTREHHVIHNFELLIASQALSSPLTVIHVNSISKLFIDSKALSS